MNTFFVSVKYFLIILSELFLLFVLISAAVEFALSYLPKEKINGWLSKKGILGYILGASIGALTPFCSCSTIPMTLGMLNAGAPLGPVMSFVISSPLLNPIIIVMIATLLGIKSAVGYFSVVFICSLLFGFLIEKAGMSTQIKNVRLKSKALTEGRIKDRKISSRLKSSLIKALLDFKGVLIYLIAGVAVGAIIYGYVPTSVVSRLSGLNSFLAIPVAAIIGIPLYIRAETAIPIGVSLAQKGVSLGAVIALIIGGAGMAIPEMSMLASIFKRRLVISIVIVIWVTAVLSGFLFEIIS